MAEFAGGPHKHGLHDWMVSAALIRCLGISLAPLALPACSVTVLAACGPLHYADGMGVEGGCDAMDQVVFVLRTGARGSWAVLPTETFCGTTRRGACVRDCNGMGVLLSRMPFGEPQPDTRLRSNQASLGCAQWGPASLDDVLGLRKLGSPLSSIHLDGSGQQSQSAAHDVMRWTQLRDLGQHSLGHWRLAPVVAVREVGMFSGFDSVGTTSNVRWIALLKGPVGPTQRAEDHARSLPVPFLPFSWTSCVVTFRTATGPDIGSSPAHLTAFWRVFGQGSRGRGADG